MRDLPGAGTVCLLTTYERGGALHARPVTVWPGHCACDLLILTEADAAKVDEIAANPQVSLAGPSADGWWSADGTATLDPDAVQDTLRAAGLPPHHPVTVVRVSITRLRAWTITGSGPWDNTYLERTYP